MEEVRAARLALAKVWHPDRFENDAPLRARAETKLKEINWAYETLVEHLDTSATASSPNSTASDRGQTESERTTSQSASTNPFGATEPSAAETAGGRGKPGTAFWASVALVASLIALSGGSLWALIPLFLPIWLLIRTTSVRRNAVVHVVLSFAALVSVFLVLDPRPASFVGAALGAFVLTYLVARLAAWMRATASGSYQVESVVWTVSLVGLGCAVIRALVPTPPLSDAWLYLCWVPVIVLLEKRRLSVN